MTDLAGQPDWAAELRKERTTLGDAQDLIALAPAVADEIERLRDLVYRTKPGTHPLLPEGQLWRDQFDIACEQWKQESLLACDLRTSQDQIIARCAKAVEEKWPEAAKAIRGHVDGISGEDFGELNRELDRLRATNAALVKAVGPFARNPTRADQANAPEKGRHWQCWVTADELADLRRALTPTPAPQPEISGRGASVLGRPE